MKRETFSETMKAASHYARRLAGRRGDHVVHNGHLLIGIIATDAHQEVHGLTVSKEAGDQIERYLDEDALQHLVHHDRELENSSDARVIAVRAAIMRARHRQSDTITPTDVIWGIIASAPNAGTYILEKLGIDCSALRRSL